ADEFVQATATLEQEVADETALRERQAELSSALEEARAAEGRLEADLHQVASRLARAQETWYRLSGLRERLRGTASLAAERSRHLASVAVAERPGHDPDQ